MFVLTLPRELRLRCGKLSVETRKRSSDTSAVANPTVAPTSPGRYPALLSRTGSALFIAATALLVWGTAFNGRSFGPIRFLLRATPHGDKVGHFVLYGAIVFAVGLVVRRRTTAVLSAFVVLLVGIADEYRQLLVGGRNFDLDDILANAGGVCLGLLAALLVLNQLARRRRSDPTNSVVDPNGPAAPHHNQKVSSARV